MANPLTANFFELFALPAQFDVDPHALERSYLEVQAKVHPDRFAHASDVEKRLSMQLAARANEAYRTLKDPMTRGRYLLQLRGVDTREETNTSMPADFLMAQMEWREAIDEARAQCERHELQALHGRLLREHESLVERLSAALASGVDDHRAAEIVRKLRFFDRLDEEIRAAIEQCSGPF